MNQSEQARPEAFDKAWVETKLYGTGAIVIHADGRIEHVTLDDFWLTREVATVNMAGDGVVL